MHITIEIQDLGHYTATEAGWFGVEGNSDTNIVDELNGDFSLTSRPVTDEPPLIGMVNQVLTRYSIKILEVEGVTPLPELNALGLPIIY